MCKIASNKKDKCNKSNIEELILPTRSLILWIAAKRHSNLKNPLCTIKNKLKQIWSNHAHQFKPCYIRHKILRKCQMCTLITHVRTNQILFCCVCMMLLDANFMLHELAVCHTVRCCSTYITLQNAQGSTYIFSHAFLTLLEKGPSVPVENELRYRFYNRCYQTETNVTA